MVVTVFDTHKFDRQYLEQANQGRHQLKFLEARLSISTAELAKGSKAVCCFVNDCVDADTIAKLKLQGIELIALRSAGYNHVDLKAASQTGIKVVRVPAYSPYAVAEHAVALLLDHNRKISKAHNRVRDLNFSLDGLVGFDLHGKTVGVIGTGEIGKVFSRIMLGFGCRVIAFDKMPALEWARSVGVEYVELNELLRSSDIVSLHVPLNSETRHIIDQSSFSRMKPAVVLINTGRGGLIDTKALIQALKRKQIGGACLDVYEEEEGVFFCDLSETGVNDDTLARLLTFPNVTITSHQAFLTREALEKIATTTINNLTLFEEGKAPLERTALV